MSRFLINSERHQSKKTPVEVCSKQVRKGPVKPKHSSLPISIPRVTDDKHDESVSRLTKEYDCATWNMYNRIMLHRRMKSCSMKGNPTSVTLSHFLEPKVEGGSKSDESNTRETVETQQECYCLDTNEHDCLQFQLEED